MDSSVCPKCNHNLENQAKFCSNCGYPLKKKGKNSPSCLGWILIFSGIFLLMFLFGNNKQDKGKKPTSPHVSTRLAYNMSKDFVRKNLKSPSTAKFPGLFESEDHVKYIGSGKYKIISWVDSQNSFGATIRTKYSCTMIDKGNNTWGIEDLVFY